MTIDGLTAYAVDLSGNIYTMMTYYFKRVQQILLNTLIINNYVSVFAINIKDERKGLRILKNVGTHFVFTKCFFKITTS